MLERTTCCWKLDLCPKGKRTTNNAGGVYDDLRRDMALFSLRLFIRMVGVYDDLRRDMALFSLRLFLRMGGVYDDLRRDMTMR